MSINCTNLTCCKEAVIINPYTAEAKAMNVQSVYAMRGIGKGRAGLENFCARMDLLPPVSTSNYQIYNEVIAEAIGDEVLQNMEAASAHLHHLYGVAPSEIIDVAVTCDGTWSKRGFTATYGVIVVISWLSGQVLDYEILSKRCTVCAIKKETIDESSEEFKAWYEVHKPHCELNHFGSSPLMESEGAMKLWTRSVEKLHLRYTTVISDGDSKTHKQLVDLQPYGLDVVIEKNECVGHVEKRMGTRLRNLKKTKVYDKDGKLLKWGEAGRLTNGFIDKITQYYGNAIRAHTNDLQGMYETCWAVFHHCSSHDGNPQHDMCPKGINSWCRYNKAIACLEFDDFPPPHNPTYIPPDLVEHVKPVFVALTDRKLLERCLIGATQNQNESLNNMIWSLAPKTEFLSLASVQISVGEAVLTFNSGKMALVPIFPRPYLLILPE